MENRLETRLAALEKKTDAIYRSVERTRKYFLFTLVGSIVMIVLPLLGIVLVLPWLMTTLLSGYGI